MCYVTMLCMRWCTCTAQQCRAGQIIINRLPTLSIRLALNLPRCSLINFLACPITVFLYHLLFGLPLSSVSFDEEMSPLLDDTVPIFIFLYCVVARKLPFQHCTLLTDPGVLFSVIQFNRFSTEALLQVNCQEKQYVLNNFMLLGEKIDIINIDISMYGTR